MKKARICLVFTCVLLAAACGGSDTPVDTSQLSDREKEWVEYSYAHEKNDETKRAWEEQSAEGVKSYLERQLPTLCGDTASLMKSLKEAGYEAGEAQDYKEKVDDLLCSP
ncbi:hypothetical protein RM863_14500 [Streptomyces sp. DSM 41014]|uniref:Lipoprotein n=1 Tax=Streptomyces hintoniae TaxID=3075521 RepID=A0ABU2UJK5_9ACTN|nr:hypothetical protein [Streptomyces sp. DSM 41014]MDT0473338.1 hypothetical protein [Streptomyces sp. DSM 41014]